MPSSLELMRNGFSYDIKNVGRSNNIKENDKRLNIDIFKIKREKTKQHWKQFRMSLKKGEN